MIVIWAGYGFWLGISRSDADFSWVDLHSSIFPDQPAPWPLQPSEDIVLPAPALVSGIATAWVLNQSAPAGYLLGEVKHGGWWYFFLVGVAVKTPLPFLLLSLVGIWAIFSPPVRWTAIAPALAVAAIFLVTMFVKYNAGVRHVMVIFPLLAVIAGCGCNFLWRSPGKLRVWGRGAVVVLLLWQCVSSLKAAPDYIAYFNELAGRDPSRILLVGCDLDCGQDLFRLSNALRERHISQLNLAVWSSADMTQMELPAFDILPPFKPVTGWVAISLRSMHVGDVFHATYPSNAFAWLISGSQSKRLGKQSSFTTSSGRSHRVSGSCRCTFCRTSFSRTHEANTVSSCLHRGALCLQWLSAFEVKLNRPILNSRRWTVIASGLLCGALALVVLFTNRGAFLQSAGCGRNGSSRIGGGPVATPAAEAQ